MGYVDTGDLDAIWTPLKHFSHLDYHLHVQLFMAISRNYCSLIHRHKQQQVGPFKQHSLTCRGDNFYGSLHHHVVKTS